MKTHHLSSWWWRWHNPLSLLWWRIMRRRGPPYPLPCLGRHRPRPLLVKFDSEFFRIHIPSIKLGFDMLDPFVVAVLLIANDIAVSGIRKTCLLIWLTFVISFVHGKASNLTLFIPYGIDDVFNFAAILYWSYSGFHMVSTMADETKNPLILLDDIIPCDYG